MALAVSACGGGGGGSQTNTSQPILSTGSPTTGVSAGGGTGGSAGGSQNSPSIVQASSVDTSNRLVLEVQPIQVCDDDGLVCAQVELFEAIADKAWDQADIDIVFLPLNQLNDSTYLTTDEDEFFDLSFSGAPSDFGRHPDSSRTEGPINLWFVDEIQTGAGLVQFGNAWIGVNGVVISDDILDFDRIDVIAHELGHNLGLRHSTLGAGPANNLLTGGGSRTIPGSLDDIFPDGDRLSQLTPEQIERAQNSNFVKPSSASDAVPTVLLAEADAITISEMDAIPMAEADTVPIESLALAPTAHAIPETSPSAVTWLLLLPLGKRLYRRCCHG